MNIQDFVKPVVELPVVTCHYCKGPAALVDGRKIYPHRVDLWNTQYWLCAADGAWVGVHQGTMRPLGILANKELRGLKIRVHTMFDPLWGKYSNALPPGPGRPPFKRDRAAAYAWLAKELGITPAECHVGMFENPRCKEAIRVMRTQWDLLGWQLPLAERQA